MTEIDRILGASERNGECYILRAERFSPDVWIKRIESGMTLLVRHYLDSADMNAGPFKTLAYTFLDPRFYEPGLSGAPR